MRKPICNHYYLFLILLSFLVGCGDDDGGKIEDAVITFLITPSQFCPFLSSTGFTPEEITASVYLSEDDWLNNQNQIFEGALDANSSINLGDIESTSGYFVRLEHPQFSTWTDGQPLDFSTAASRSVTIADIRLYPNADNFVGTYTLESVILNETELIDEFCTNTDNSIEISKAHMTINQQSTICSIDAESRTDVYRFSGLECRELTGQANLNGNALVVIPAIETANPIYGELGTETLYLQEGVILREIQTSDGVGYYKYVR